jgi:3-methyl-2-oxobutanoate hydroxymethyltransferase
MSASTSSSSSALTSASPAVPAVYGAGKQSIDAPRKPVSLPRLAEMRARGEKITMLTAYDATFASVMDAAGVDCILVGDSLGMVCQGLPSTVGVSLETMRYHVESVFRGLQRSQGTTWLIGDLPFGTYHESKEQALRSASVLMQAGAHMVKLEGGGWTAEVVRFLVERGIPVCAHLGLTPQTVHALGGYRVQGKGDEAAAALRRHAHELQDAGAQMLVLEMVPHQLATSLTQELTSCHTIGIGAGNGCAGQVLVLHDMLGINLGRMPKFVHNFLAETGNAGGGDVKQAFASYVQAVKSGSFPDNAKHAW